MTRRMCYDTTSAPIWRCYHLVDKYGLCVLLTNAFGCKIFMVTTTTQKIQYVYWLRGTFSREEVNFKFISNSIHRKMSNRLLNCWSRNMGFVKGKSSFSLALTSKHFTQLRIFCTKSHNFNHFPRFLILTGA